MYSLVDEYARVDVNEKPRGQPIGAQVIFELHEHDDDPLGRVQVAIVRRRRLLSGRHRRRRTLEPPPVDFVAPRVHRIRRRGTTAPAVHRNGRRC